MNQIYPSPHTETFSYATLGTVTLSESGIAKKIKSYGKISNVYAQASHLPPLKNNDEILFFETAKGPYIIASTLQTNENPKQQLQFGKAKISITSTGDILLTTAKAKLILTAEGDIQLEGKNLKQSASEDLQLKAGHHIHLNSFD